MHPQLMGAGFRGLLRICGILSVRFSRNADGQGSQLRPLIKFYPLSVTDLWGDILLEFDPTTWRD